MSRWDIADYLGLTVETVSREIQAAKASGVIAMPDRHHFLVVDAQRLAAAAALG
jgi:CRP/FNR family transcriptional regulator